MKLASHGTRRLFRSAFTLPEMMVTIAISTIVVGGVLFSHITGLKMYEIVKSKMGATDDTRRAVGLLVNELRTGKVVKVGNASSSANSSFTEAADGSSQQGNAIQIYPLTNLTKCIQYYLDTNQAKLFRSLNGTSVQVIARNVTNSVVFRSEDFVGNVLTDNQDNRVIAMSLNFYQLQSFGNIGTNKNADYYQLQIKIARRVL